ncbi:MAG: hypothetical protein WCO25_05985 [Candidatus Uhrbacteria bacterium]
MQGILDFFDKPVESVGLSERTVAYLRSYGVRFVGEIPRFEWSHAIGLGIDRLFRSQHLLPSIDPWSLGWRPAYLRDPAVRAALLLPSTLAFRDRGVWDPHPLETKQDDCEVEMRPYVGQSIADLPKVNGRLEFRQARTIQYALDLVPAFVDIHAAMHLPEDFVDERGEETVPEVAAYRARQARARALLVATFDQKSWAPGHTEELRPNWVDGLKYPDRWISGKGMSFVRDDYKDRMILDEARRRREILAAVLKAEGVNPHFFALATRIHKVYFGKARTVREFLAIPREEFWQRWLSSDIPDHLAAWGLKFGMTKEELDDLFGPDLSSKAVAEGETIPKETTATA